MAFHIELSGRQFGRLTVLRYLFNSEWACKCECGKECVVMTDKLKSGHTRSCGCLKRDAATKHNDANSAEHRAWISMRSRCNNPNDNAYHNYGGRGVKVSEAWDDYSVFLAEMGRKPHPKMQIDRKDNSKGYQPGNCQWATCKKNQNNKRSNRRVDFGGRTQTIAEWAEEIGINYRTLNNRINRGWPLARALTEPVTKETS